MRKVILLLTFVMMLALLAAVSVLAAGDPVHTLTFNFDSQKCTVELESNQLDKIIQMENGVPVEIPNGAYVKVTVKPKTGYTVADIKDAETNLTLTKQDRTVYIEEFFTSSKTANVECTTKVFSVRFEVKAEDLLYDLVDSTWDDWRDVKYYYMQPDQITVLPDVQRTGYTFQGWYLVNSDGTVSGALPKYDENGDANGENQYRYYMSPDLPITTEINTSGIIYVHAEFTPDPQPVIRYDQVTKFNETTGQWVDGKVLNGNGYLWEAPTGETVSGLTFVPGNDVESDDPDNPYLNYFSYPGYRLVTDWILYSANAKPIIPATPENPNPNARIRYYTPIVYTLVYDLDGGEYAEGTLFPTTYTYEEYTALVQPTRRGYIFSGWEVKVDGKVVTANTDTDFVLGNSDTVGNALYAAATEKIELRAIWTPEVYDITYNWGNVPAELIPVLNELNATLPTKITFDQADFFIPNPVRPGYQFAGWMLSYTDGGQSFDDATSGLTAGEGGYYLDSAKHTQDITLTASWTVESYKVTLDGQGAANEFTNEIPEVEYDAEWSLPDGFVLPEREGFEFDGYWSALEGGEKYINADGTINVLVWKLDDTAIAGEVTLYARWIRKSFSVNVNISGLPAGTEADIKIQVGENTFYPNGTELPFETEYKVIITMPAGHMLVEWNGTAITPTNSFASDMLTVGAAAQVWGAASQPQAPQYGSNGLVIGSNTGFTDTQIKVEMNSDVAHLYEFAILENNSNPNDLTEADWQKIVGEQNYYLFDNLNPGTTYYVFVRLQEDENDGVPAGIIYVHSSITTTHTEYVTNVKNALDNLLTDADGDIANGVIDAAKKEIDNLVGTDTFYVDVEELIASIEAKLALARLKDSKIAELEKFREDCELSGLFNQTNIEQLQNFCQAAVTAITLADRENENETDDDVAAKVNKAYSDAMTAMKAVPISYLRDANGNMQLTSNLGLSQGAGITISSIQDIEDLRRAIADAIAAGKITASSFITVDEAADILRTLDTVAAYNFYLINVQPTAGDTFMLTMTIPESLAGRTGLQVAYYNVATGMVELLQTKQEGSTLVFYANQIGDFVILADPTVDLTPVLLVLSAIVLCQLIAIALVLISRNKGKNTVKHASVALPMFMTIYFLPHNAELIALGLVGIIVLLQIILMWLLLASGMIRVRKSKKAAPAKQAPATEESAEELPSESDMQNDAETAEEQFIDQTADEKSYEESYAESYEEPAEQTLSEDAFDEDLARELAVEQDDVMIDEEETAEDLLPEEIEEIYDDEEFIEPAPTPYYSLDDQEDAFAYDEAEQLQEDVEEEIEDGESAYAADPFDEIFGDTDAEADVSEYDEGTDLYLRSEGETFEYDEDGSYEDGTEATDGEETEGQGTVDPYAYVVEDDGEEVSDDEEMYRYDE